MYTPISCRRTLALISGDFAALMIFAAIGRGSHGKSLDAISVLTTAAPFLIGAITLQIGRLISIILRGGLSAIDSERDRQYMSLAPSRLSCRISWIGILTASTQPRKYVRYSAHCRMVWCC